jgi:hypothetical protein
MPQVSFEFLQIASLSRRRHGFDSRTGRQSPKNLKIFLAARFADLALMDARSS